MKKLLVTLLCLFSLGAAKYPDNYVFSVINGITYVRIYNPTTAGITCYIGNTTTYITPKTYSPWYLFTQGMYIKCK